MVEDKALVECGLTPGDAIRLKCGVTEWWNGPEAKRSRTESTNTQLFASSPKPKAIEYDIRFEKRYVGGGCMSFFGSGLVTSKRRKKEYVWWYHNPVTRCLEQVLDGYVPHLDPHYYEDDLSFGNSPCVTDTEDVAN